MSLDVNALYRSEASVYDDTGTLTDPSTKTLTVTAPDQTTSTPAISSSGTGQFYADIPLNQEGLWKFVWSTTGPVTSKTDYESAVAYRSIVSLSEMRAYLHLSSTAQDDLLRGFMRDATELIEKHCGPCIIRTYTDDHIPGYQKPVLRLPHGPVPSTSSVTSISTYYDGGPTWTQENGDFIVYPQAGTVELSSRLAFWLGPWKATYTAGRMVIPARLVLAAKIIVDDLWAQHRQTVTDPLTPTYDDETMLMERMPAGYEMPPRAASLIKRERRPGFG